MPERGASNRVSSTAPFWERAGAVLGGLLALVLLGYLLWHAIAGGEGPPDIVVEAGEVHRVDSGYLLTFSASNKGSETAADVVIRGELSREGRGLESARVTLDYLPPRSVREGGMFFRRDPREHVLVLRPEAYSRP